MPDRPLAIACRHAGLRVDRRAVAAAIRVLDGAGAGGAFRGGCPPGEVSIVFLTDRALARLHGRFLADPTVTDVITFEGDRGFGVAGEICVSADAAARQRGRVRGVPRGGGGSPGRTRKGAAAPSLSDELTLYVVHGWLHLAGYGDLAPAPRRLMRAAEARAMRLLRGAGVRPKFSLRRPGLARAVRGSRVAGRPAPE